MQKPTLLLSALLLSALPAAAQLNAGDIPAGFSVLEPGIDLELYGAFTQDSAFIDLDCDGQPELMVMLWRGEPAIDASNFGAIHLLDTGMALCADGAMYNWRPQYYDFGNSLNCTGNFSWRSDSITWLGNFGDLLPVGPTSLNSKYVAYNYNGQIGWILLSFDVFPELDAPITLQVHEVLRPCLAQSVGSLGKDARLTLFPNPGDGADIRIHSTDVLRSIDLLAPTGKLLARHTGDLRSIPAPEAAGIYFLRAQHNDGQWSVSRLVRE
ncbi:MAG: hypothetical protein WAT61_04765 [Flavobacteriales bacterium]